MESVSSKIDLEIAKLNKEIEMLKRRIRIAEMKKEHHSWFVDCDDSKQL